MNENVKDISECEYLRLDWLRRNRTGNSVFVDIPVDDRVINCEQWEGVGLGDVVILRNGQRELIHGIYGGFINSFMHPHFHSVEIQVATKN